MTEVSSTVSTLVVCWNNREFLGRCLESVPACSEVIVVDNASTDGSADFVAERFPWVRLVRNGANVGFAAGVNQAASFAKGDYLLLLNPDAEATPKSIERLVAALEEHATCGAAAGRLLSMTEEVLPDFHARRLPTLTSLAADLLLVSRVWPSNPVTRQAEGADLNTTVAGPVEQMASSGLLVRRAMFDAIGGLDEQFFPAWFEDVDFCKRLRDRGWEIYFVPGAVFRHIGGVSTGGLGRARQKWFFYRNLERYVRKHHGRPGAAAIRVILIAGMGMRMAGSALRADRDGVHAFAGVLGGTLSGWRDE
jgi:N-acetylglucosaminyl-diphospho-decaprenol L-rhamnosyltransferase